MAGIIHFLSCVRQMTKPANDPRRKLRQISECRNFHSGAFPYLVSPATTPKWKGDTAWGAVFPFLRVVETDSKTKRSKRQNTNKPNVISKQTSKQTSRNPLAWQLSQSLSQRSTPPLRRRLAGDDTKVAVASASQVKTPMHHGSSSRNHHLFTIWRGGSGCRAGANLCQFVSWCKWSPGSIEVKVPICKVSVSWCKWKCQFVSGSIEVAKWGPSMEPWIRIRDP